MGTTRHEILERVRNLPAADVIEALKAHHLEFLPKIEDNLASHKKMITILTTYGTSSRCHALLEHQEIVDELESIRVCLIAITDDIFGCYQFSESARFSEGRMAQTLRGEVDEGRVIFEGSESHHKEE